MVIQFIIEVWDRTIKRTRTIPMTEVQYLTGSWISGIVRGIITLTIILSMAYFLFDVNLLAGEIKAILTILFGMAVVGLVISMFIISAIKFLGHRAESLAWFMTDVLVVFSGIYYSISILPKALQYVSYSIPLTYIFDSLRKILIDGAVFTDLIGNFIRLFGLLGIYLVLVTPICGQ